MDNFQRIFQFVGRTWLVGDHNVSTTESYYTSELAALKKVLVMNLGTKGIVKKNVWNAPRGDVDGDYLWSIIDNALGTLDVSCEIESLEEFSWPDNPIIMFGQGDRIWRPGHLWATELLFEGLRGHCIKQCEIHYFHAYNDII